jgi:Holliday junction resolvasome RuvABC endonuclease subunit
MTSIPEKIIAFDVRACRFGFAVFEGPDELLDWGVKSFRRGINAVKVPASQKVATLLSEFRPHVIVVEKLPPRENSWLMGTIMKLARKQHVPVRAISRTAVRKRFLGQGQSKHNIAMVLSDRFPELTDRIPPKRKAWQSEDYRMSIFDAAALGLTHFGSHAKSS